VSLGRRNVRIAVRTRGGVRGVGNCDVVSETALVVNGSWEIVGDSNLVVDNVSDVMRPWREVHPHEPNVIRPGESDTRNMSKRFDCCGEVTCSFSIGCRPFQLSSPARMRITLLPAPRQ
jgi:hypothetical protein